MKKKREVPGFALLVVLAIASASPSGAGVVRQVTDVKTTVAGPGAITDAGSLVFTGASSDPQGTNPSHSFQIMQIDPLTGAMTQTTSAADGTSILLSVNDDGRYLAFPSPADLTGGNHDQSVELFVLDRSTSQTSQLTNDPAPNAGSVSAVAMAGIGNRIAFLANTDPLGSNPQHLDQLFVVDRDGTGLRQITATAAGSWGAISISDDGTRIAFSCDGDLTGANPDLGSEIFLISWDGTGLRQMTSTPATFGSSSPSLSGNGQRIAFESNGNLTGGNVNNQTEIFVINWDGTGLRQLTTTGRVFGLFGDPASLSPSITDDGLIVVFSSNHSKLFLPVNLDGNFEIFKIRTDGTGLVMLTSTALTYGGLFPTVAGGAGRITYYGVGTQVTLEAMDGAGGNKRTLLSFDIAFNGEPDVSPGGGRVVFTQTVGLLAGGQIWRVNADGSDLAQVTSLSSEVPGTPSLAGDGQTIVFSVNNDPLGTSTDGSIQIFTILADGSGSRQLTNGAAKTSSQHPVISTDGSRVVFDSDADLVGTNADGSTEIFKINLDGTGLAQLTSGIAETTSAYPRVDATGTWAVFESNADLDGGNPDGSYEVYRVRLDGAGLQRLTGDPAADSGNTDISGAGDRIVYTSAADPLGANPELNPEVFLYDAAASSLIQLTSFAKGGSGGARISGNGAWVYFSSSAPIFEADPDEPTDLYRISTTSSTIERVGALRAGMLGGIGFGPISLGGGGSLAVDDSGEVAAFTGIGDFTEANKDMLPEIWVLDRLATPAFNVGKESPTVLSWSIESGPVRYDAIRGEVSRLRGAGATIDLGPVICLEDDSPDADTVGFGDPVDPAPGQAFFYVYRGSQGLLAGPGAYGQSSDGRERVPSTGDCPAN